MPQLMLDGFLVPHDEVVREVLRDDEVVDVEPNRVAITALVAQVPVSAAASTTPKKPAAALDNGAVHEIPAKRPKKSGAAVTAAGAATPALGWRPPADGRGQAISDPASKNSGASVSGAPPTMEKAGVSRKAAPVVADESSDDSDSEEEDEEDRETVVKPNAAAGSASMAGRKSGKGELASGGARIDTAATAAARSAALATCGSGPSTIVEDSAAAESTDIFVGGLPYTVEDAGLRKHFAQYGNVESATVVLNNHTGKSKGFGFVSFRDAATCAKVLADGPNQMINGKLVEVKPRQPKGGGKAGGKDKGKGKGCGKNGKAGKDASKSRAQHALPAPREPAPVADSESSEDEEEEEEKPKAPAARASSSAEVSVAKKRAAGKSAGAQGTDETEMQRQMAAMGLPVSFTASDGRGEESDEDDEDDEEDQ